MNTFHDGSPEVDESVGASPGDALSGGELQRRAVRGSLWTSIHTISSVPVAFLANAVAARALGVADYGTLAFLTVWFAIAVQIANAGFSASIIQWGASAEARGERAQADDLLRRSMGFHVAVELPLLVAAVWALARDEGWLVIGLLVFSSVMTCVFSGAALALTIENRSASVAKLAMISNLAVQGATVLAALLAGTPMAVFGARLVVSAVAVPALFLLLGRARRRTVLQMRFPRSMPSGFWRFALLSFGAGLLSMLVFSRSEIFLLSWLSTPEAVGLFALAFGLSYQLTAPVDAMLNPLLPAVAGLVSAHPELAHRAFLRASRFAALLTGVITGVLLPLVYFAIPVIYGSGFERAADLLLPLALVSCMQSICQPITAFAYARHQGGRLLRSNAVALAINVLVALALIGPLGVWGAVIANAVGQIAAIMVLGRHELRLQALTLRAFVSAVRLWPVASLAGLLCIGVLSMAATAGTPDWVTLVAAPFVGAVLLIALARACKAGLLEADQAPLLEAMPRRLRSVFARLTMFFIIDETPGFATRVSSEKTADPRENQ